LAKENPLIFKNNCTQIENYHSNLVPWIESSSTLSPTKVIDEHEPVQTLSFEHFDVFISKKPRIAIIYGISNYLSWQKWIDNHKDTLQRIVILEPDPTCFSVTLKKVSLTNYLSDSRFHWLIGHDIDQLEEVLKQDVVTLGTWGLHCIYSKQATVSTPERWQFVQNTIEHCLRVAAENVKVQITRGISIQTNIIRNIPYFLRSIDLSSMIDQMKGVPAIIIGAGPSLDKNIDQLKNISPNILLLATDTAYRLLVKRNIQPHIVITCDPQSINQRHFDGIQSLGNAILAYLPESTNQILEQFSSHGPKLGLFDNQSKLLNQLFSIKKPFHRGMNVGYCAFSLAIQLGCSPIILMGMDLSIQPGKLSHASGSANQSNILLTNSNNTVVLEQSAQQYIQCLQVEGYYDEPVTTLSYFYPVLQRFEQTIATINIPVIDSTEGGAKKQGSVRMPLHQALQENPGSQSIESLLFNLEQMIEHFAK
jgi:hypothetical protein